MYGWSVQTGNDVIGEKSVKSGSESRICDRGVWLLMLFLFQYVFFAAQAAYPQVAGPAINTIDEPPQNAQQETLVGQTNPDKPKPQQFNASAQHLEKTAKELQRLRQSLADMEQENQRLRKEAERIPKIYTAQTAALNGPSAADKEELENLKARLASLKDENKAIRNNSDIKWFMAGGGVFLAGWLAGFVVGRIRRKRPSLL